ncbi:hypothetical protein NFJ02_38g95500 [Pycnococcus provasolii]
MAHHVDGALLYISRPKSRVESRTNMRVAMLSKESVGLGLGLGGAGGALGVDIPGSQSSSALFGRPSTAFDRLFAPSTTRYDKSGVKSHVGGGGGGAAKQQGLNSLRPATRGSPTASPMRFPSLGPSHSAPDVGMPTPSPWRPTSFKPAHDRATSRPSTTHQQRRAITPAPGMGRPPRLSMTAPRQAGTATQTAAKATLGGRQSSPDSVLNSSGDGGGKDPDTSPDHILHEMLALSGANLPATFANPAVDDYELSLERKAQESALESDANNAANHVFKLNDELNAFKRTTEQRENTLRELTEQLHAMDYDSWATLTESETMRSSASAWSGQHEEVTHLTEEQVNYDIKVVQHMVKRTESERSNAEREVYNAKQALIKANKALHELHTRLAVAQSEEQSAVHEIERIMLEESHKRSVRSSKLYEAGAKVKSIVASHANRAKFEKRRIMHGEEARKKMIEDLELKMGRRVSNNMSSTVADPLTRKIEMKRRAAFLKIQQATGATDLDDILYRWQGRDEALRELQLKMESVEQLQQDKVSELRQLREQAFALSSSGFANQFRWKEYDNLETKASVLQSRKDLAGERYIGQLQNIQLSANGIGEVLGRLGVDIRQDMIRITRSLGGYGTASSSSGEGDANAAAGGEQVAASESGSQAGSTKSVTKAAPAPAVDDGTFTEQPYDAISTVLGRVEDVLGEVFDIVSEEQKKMNLESVDLDGDGVADHVVGAGQSMTTGESSLPTYNTRITRVMSRRADTHLNGGCCRAPLAQEKKKRAKAERSFAHTAVMEDNAYVWKGITDDDDMSDIEDTPLDPALQRAAQNAESANYTAHGEEPPDIPRLNIGGKEPAHKTSISNMIKRERFVRSQKNEMGVNDTRTGGSRAKQTLARSRMLMRIGRTPNKQDQ